MWRANGSECESCIDQTNLGGIFKENSTLFLISLLSHFGAKKARFETFLRAFFQVFSFNDLRRNFQLERIPTQLRRVIFSTCIRKSGAGNSERRNASKDFKHLRGFSFEGGVRFGANRRARLPAPKRCFVTQT